VRQFDDAFNSRISVKLFYDQLTAAARQSIWKQILAHSLPQVTFSQADFQSLQDTDLNGREIKNIVKLAAAKAKGMQTQVTYDSLLAEVTTYKQSSQ